jgi:hypothetical protein
MGCGGDVGRKRRSCLASEVRNPGMPSAVRRRRRSNHDSDQIAIENRSSSNEDLKVYSYLNRLFLLDLVALA